MKATGAPVLYRDRFIECTTDALVIHGYFFRSGSKKTIPIWPHQEAQRGQTGHRDRPVAHLRLGRLQALAELGPWP